MPPFLFQGGAIDPLAILLLALFLDALIGDPRWLWRFLPHPVALIGHLIAWLDRRLNRAQRNAAERRLRGVLATAIVLLPVAGIGGLVSLLRLKTEWGWIPEVLLAAIFLAQNSLARHVLSVARALDRGGLAAGRQAVARIVGRDPDSLDSYAVARAAIESLAENFADAVVAPTFWYVLLGLPGLMIVKAVNTLDSMIGYRNESYADFGKAAARLDDLMIYLPARLAALLLALAALFVPRGSPFAALKIMGRDHARHPSPNSGWPEAAMAGALGLALAGPRQYGGLVIPDAWIGDGKARADGTDIRLAVGLMAVACLLNFALVLGLLLLKAR